MSNYICVLLILINILNCDGQSYNNNQRNKTSNQQHIYSLNELRNSSDETNSLLVVDSGQVNTFQYDSADKKTVDDGILTLVTKKGKRYKRVLSGYTVNLKTDFGAVGDGKVDDTDKLQKAIIFQQANPTVVITVPAGIYKLSYSCVKQESFEGLEIRAVPNSVTFDYTNIGRNKPCIKIIGGSGRICQNTIEGIIFKGNNNSTGIEIAGQCGQLISKCVFQNNLVGLLYHNEKPKTFTEWSTAQNCSWETTCQYDIQYKRTNGNNSFHGSGLTGVNYVNTYKNGGTVLLIDDGCLPYNCPLNVQVWFSKNSTLVQNNNNNSSVRPYFAGNVSFERFDGTMTMAVGKPVYFSGAIESLGDYVDSGLFIQCDGVVANKNNTTTPYGIRYNTQLSVDPSTTVINAPAGAIFLVTITLVGANYDYRNVVILDCTGGEDMKGSITPIATTRNFNNAGYGPPLLSLDKEGHLQIANSNYPKTGPNQLKAYITYKQIADHYYGNYPGKSF